MQEFTKWTLERIREKGAMLSWLEENRFEWTVTISRALRQIISGKTVVLITDHDRKWLKKYILQRLNHKMNDRPIIPIIPLESIYAHYPLNSNVETLDMLETMLAQTFNRNYFFWYIGKGDDTAADLAKRSEYSYLWIMDEVFQNAMPLRSYDPQIDIMLIQLVQLFSVTLDAVIFGEIDAER